MRRGGGAIGRQRITRIVPRALVVNLVLPAIERGGHAVNTACASPLYTGLGHDFTLT